MPQVLVIICTCDGTLAAASVVDDLRKQVAADPLVVEVEVIDRTCTAAGWDELVERVKSRQPNRVLIGACLP